MESILGISPQQLGGGMEFSGAQEGLTHQLTSYLEATIIPVFNDSYGSSSSGRPDDFNSSAENGTDWTDTDYTPHYYSRNYRIVGTLFQGIILFVGVLGNAMVVYVVAKSKGMLSPTNCYLVSLALADCITLIASVPQEILSYYIVGGKWIWGDLGCATFIFSQQLGINASSLSLTAFTIERYIAICHPMKAHSICTVRRAKKIIVAVWIIAVTYCSPWLFLTKTVPLVYRGYNESVECVHKLQRSEYLGYYFADLFVFYVIPLIISMILYSLIARILFLSHRARSQEYNPPGQITVSSSSSNSSRVQVIKMLVMVVVIFAILWLPYRGLLVYNSFMHWFAKEKYMDLWFLMLAKTCIYINSAINPILYNAMSIKFRTEFSRTLRCWGSTELSSESYGGTTFRSKACNQSTTTTTSFLPSPMTVTYNENISLSSSSSHGDGPEGINNQGLKKGNARSPHRHPYSMTSATQRSQILLEPGGSIPLRKILASVNTGHSVVDCDNIPFSKEDGITQL